MTNANQDWANAEEPALPNFCSMSTDPKADSPYLYTCFFALVYLSLLWFLDSCHWYSIDWWDIAYTVIESELTDNKNATRAVISLFYLLACNYWLLVFDSLLELRFYWR